MAAARNAGIRRATAEFVAFLDSDDLWHQRKLEIQMAYLRQHPEIGLVACLPNQAPGTLQQCSMPLPGVPGTPGRGKIDVEPISCDELAEHTAFGTCSVLVRKSCLDAVGPFDATLLTAEDRDMWIRIASRFAVHRQNIGLWFDRRGTGRSRKRPKPGQDDDLSTNILRNEANMARMIEKVFREVPALSGRWLLKRRAQCVATYAIGILFSQDGQQAEALRRLWRTVILWPLPIHKAMPLRIKSLLLCLLPGLDCAGVSVVIQNCGHRLESRL